MKELSPKDARQGRKGRHVFVILIVSLILALIVWAAVGFYGSQIPGRCFMVDDSKPPASTESQPPASATGTR